MKFVNLTDHAINLNSGEVFEKSGIVCRIPSSLRVSDVIDGIRIFTSRTYEIENLPDPEENTIYIVSNIILDKLHKKFSMGYKPRFDVCAPATTHRECVRDENGRVISVPGFIR